MFRRRITDESARLVAEWFAGDAALYVDPNDTQSISAGMQRVLSDETLRSDLIERGLRRAKNFTWEKTAGETLKVFDEILG